MKELIVNIWIYIDLETELAYNWAGKVYNTGGTDEEKFTLLKDSLPLILQQLKEGHSLKT